jgi:hypothetical protein
MRFPSIALSGTLLLFIALGPGSACGQSQTPAASQQEPVPASAQPTRAQDQASPLPNAKPAKVWTNDEIKNLPSKDDVSIVGKPATQNASATSNTLPPEKDAAWYRRQLATLHDEIDKLDPQIAKLQAYLSGENVGEQASIHPKRVPTPQDQLKQMQAKRQADLAKIDDLLDRARHNGILPGALR